MLNDQLELHGILVRTGSIVDATLIPSTRSHRKVEEVIPDEIGDAGEDDDDDRPTGYTVETTYSDDHDARWTRKGKVFCCGYKGHIAVDTGHATAGNRADCREMMKVFDESGLETGAPVLADKGYSSAANQCALEEAGYCDLIMYKASRGHPLSEAQRAVNRAISKVRSSVERAFGYGLCRAKYMGTAKMTMQLMIMAMPFNLKKAAMMVRA